MTMFKVRRIRYAVSGITPLKQVERGNWIDVRSAVDVEYKAGDVVKVSLGFALELEPNEEAIVVSRSSTFKNFGVLQTNGFGVIDSSFCGDDDIWFVEYIAMRDGKISKNDRIAQFKIVERMGKYHFSSVSILGNKSRGGHGSSGIK